MTTNVYDKHSGIMATDSRWSVLFGNRILYVDDVNCSKIELYRNAAFMFAGRGNSIQQWKDWLASAPTDFTTRPSHDGLCVCMVDTKSMDVLMKQPQQITRDGGHFAGSGSRPAYMCWNVNRDASLAVQSAISADHFSGGMVRYRNFKTAVDNLRIGPVAEPLDVKRLSELILERGVVMTIGNQGNQGANPPFKLSSQLVAAAANDDELASVLRGVEQGTIVPDAPCDGMYTEWTPEQVENLDRALEYVFSN